MSANTFGRIFKFHSFGESHGSALGATIEGCPAGLTFNQELLHYNLSRRRPGQSVVSTSRLELDQFEVLSGVFEGKTLGTPITMIVHNQDARSQDYQQIKSQPRVGHADDVWKDKFSWTDWRGGGRSSGRETLARVLAGSVAQMLVQQLSLETKVIGFTRAIHNIEIDIEDSESIDQLFRGQFDLESNRVRMPSVKKAKTAEELLIRGKEIGESYGGVADIHILRPLKGLGQPVFRKLKSDLAAAYMSVGAVCGVELGAGFSGARQTGTEFHQVGSQGYGGIRGGISTGENISFRVAFKPTSSIMDVAKKGRHDPCIVPRAIPVLEAMTYLVLADHLLWRRLDKV